MGNNSLRWSLLGFNWPWDENEPQQNSVRFLKALQMMARKVKQLPQGLTRFIQSRSRSHSHWIHTIQEIWVQRMRSYQNKKNMQSIWISSAWLIELIFEFSCYSIDFGAHLPIVLNYILFSNCSNYEKWRKTFAVPFIRFAYCLCMGFLLLVFNWFFSTLFFSYLGRQ